jgi:hypothetical protein
MFMPRSLLRELYGHQFGPSCVGLLLWINYPDDIFFKQLLRRFEFKKNEVTEPWIKKIQDNEWESGQKSNEDFW